MSNLYKTRAGGATVTIFVPYDCGNNCPFCINKQEYSNTEGFSLDKICESIRLLDSITPGCDFVFTGGEPLADLEALQVMLDTIPSTHKIFINTTLPVMKNNSEDEVVAFINGNKDRITCVNVSRHLVKYVVEGDDGIFDKLLTQKRINCVLFGKYAPEKLPAFIERFKKHGLPIQFRADYTETTPENLYSEDADTIFRDLSAILECTSLSGCRIRCNYVFGKGEPEISYHKTLPYSTITETGSDGVVYDILYDVLIKQNGDIHSDWTGAKLDIEKYRAVKFEPSDLKKIR